MSGSLSTFALTSGTRTSLASCETAQLMYCVTAAGMCLFSISPKSFHTNDHLVTNTGLLDTRVVC